MKFILLAAALFLGWVFYDYKMAGLDTRPEMPIGAFSLSFKNGFRGIVIDQPDLRPEREYAGLPNAVPDWLTDVWSYCDPVTDAEKEAFPPIPFGHRPEAICRIDVEGQIVVRGLLISRPNL